MEAESATARLSTLDSQRVGIAEALLALPEPDTEFAWQQLQREALLAEVSRYRDTIRDIAARLLELGDSGLPAADEALLLLPQRQQQRGCTPADDAAAAGSLPAGVPDDDPDDADLLQLGDEGLDYTLGNVDDVDPSEWQVPPHCVPIHANVTTFDWPSLYDYCQFDVVMMDPPWQLATANPTRGVALGYSQLSDDHISGLPVPQLQRNGGFLFVWVINAKYKWTLDLFDKWGYRLVDEVVWVKMTVNRRLAKSHGYYLQHAKEVCLVAKRGNPPAPAGAGGGVGSDIIFSERRGQSQKPEEIYELIEQLVPHGRYLEIFARKNNLRDYWVSIGNEVTGTGLPGEDLRALKELNCIPGAVYGKTGGGGGGGGGAGRSASTGSGAAAEAGGSGGGGPQAGRTASTGSGAGAAAAAAGGSARGAAAAAAGATGSGRARSASPGMVAAATAAAAAFPADAAVQKQESAAGVSATAALPPLPHSNVSGAAGAGAGPSKARWARQPGAPQWQHYHSHGPPPPQQQQDGAVRPPSRLSLGVRRQPPLGGPKPLLPGEQPHPQQPDSASRPGMGDVSAAAMEVETETNLSATDGQRVSATAEGLMVGGDGTAADGGDAAMMSPRGCGGGFDGGDEVSLGFEDGLCGAVFGAGGMRCGGDVLGLGSAGAHDDRA